MIPVFRRHKIKQALKLLPTKSFASDHNGRIFPWGSQHSPFPDTEHLEAIPDPLIRQLLLTLLDSAKQSRTTEQLTKKTSERVIELSCIPVYMTKRDKAFVFLLKENTNTAPAPHPSSIPQKTPPISHGHTQITCQLNLDNEVISHDRAFLELCLTYNPSVKDVLGKSLKDILPDTIQLAILEKIALAKDTDTVTTTQFQASPDSIGPRRSNTYTASLIPIQSNTRNSSHTGVLLIIAQRLKTIHERTSDSFDQDLLKNLPAHIYWKDKTHHVVGCNQEQLHTLISSKANHNTNDFDPITLNGYEKREMEQIAKNDQLVMQSKGPLMFHENITTNNVTKTLLSKKSPLMVAGEIVGTCGVSLDITDLVRANKKSQEKIKALKGDLIKLSNESRSAEAHLQRVIDNLPGNIFWENKEGVFLGCNDQLIKWLGLKSKEELLGKHLFDLGPILGMSQDQLLAVRENDLQVMESGTAHTFEEVVYQDGKKLYFLSQKCPLFVGEECLGIIGVAMDITEQKDLEKKLKEEGERATQAHQAKSDFIANISHDLKTPLHTLQGTTELLLSEEHLPAQEKRVKTLLGCSSIMQNLVQNALQFSQLSDGTLELQESVFDLSETAQALISTLTPIAQSKDLEVHFECNIQHTTINSDINAISRVLINLIQNAIKYTKKGSLSLTITESPINGTHSNYLFTVSDTGVGISAGELPHIFSRHYQNKKNKGNGFGLGLAITERFINLLMGKVTVNSEPGKGSEFNVTLPIELAEAPSNSTQNQTLPAQKLSVLLVEDNEMIQIMTSHTLALLNCDCDIASTGEEALAKWGNKTYSLILLDLGLPDCSGLEVLQSIRSSDTTTPVIALTANTLPSIQTACSEAGASGFLPKPATREQLLIAIKNVCLVSDR